jgi:hypothetical protein
LPPSLKSKSDFSTLITTRAQDDNGIKAHRTANSLDTLGVDDCWEFFLSHLKQVSEVWGTDAAKIRSTSQTPKKSNDIGKSKKPDDPTALSIPLEAGQPTSGGNRIAANAIRKEELSLMAAEDRRRKLLLKQEGRQQQTAPLLTDEMESRSVAQDTSLQSTSKSNSSQLAQILKLSEDKLNFISQSRLQTTSLTPFDSKEGTGKDISSYTPKDFEAALKWWTTARQIQLVDRVSQRSFYFCLVKDVATDKKQSIAYSFAWKEKIQANSYDGYISLSQIKAISVSPQDDSMFVITVSESPTALKSTGGRTSVNVKCGSDNECLKYFASFGMLKEN